jgi:hypothetical protein
LLEEPIQLEPLPHFQPEKTGAGRDNALLVSLSGQMVFRRQYPLAAPWQAP